MLRDKFKDGPFLDPKALTRETMIVENIRTELAKAVGQPLADAIIDLRLQAEGELKVFIGETSFEDARMPIVRPGENEVRISFLEEKPRAIKEKAGQSLFETELRLKPIPDLQQLHARLIISSLTEQEKGKFSRKELANYYGSEALKFWGRAMDYLLTTGTKRKEQEIGVKKEGFVSPEQVLQSLQI